MPWRPMSGVVTSNGEIVTSDGKPVTHELQTAIASSAPTPASRTLVVEPESRVVLVEPENRSVLA